MQIIIKKPLYETEDYLAVGVYDKKIDKAISKKEFLEIGCKGYKQKFMPKWIRENCEIIEKIFRRPDEPMKLYKIFITKKIIEKREEEILRELSKSGVFG